MKNIKILARREKLEKKTKWVMKEYEKQTKRLEKQHEKLIKCCNHEIVIEMEVEGTWRNSKFEYCLFCREVNPWMRKHIPEDLLKKMENCITINADQYPLALPKTPTKKLRKLEKLYTELKKEFPDDSESQIVQKMKERLEEKETKKSEKGNNKEE